MGSGGGAFAEFAADFGRVLPLPVHMSLARRRPARRARDHARRRRHQRRAAPGQSVLIQGASSGVGLMGDGSPARGCRARSRLVDRCRRAAAGWPSAAPSSRSIPAIPPGWSRCWRPPMARASTSSSTRSRAGSQPEHGGDADQRPHRQCRPARRREGRVQLRPPRPAPHHLYRRHLPHPDQRRNPRIFDEVRKAIWRAVECRRLQLPSIRPTPSTKSARRSSTWKQPALRQDRPDAVMRVPGAAQRSSRCAGEPGGARVRQPLDISCEQRTGSVIKPLEARGSSALAMKSGTQGTRPVSPRLRCGFTVISTSWSNAVSIRSSFSTETSFPTGPAAAWIGQAV